MLYEFDERRQGLAGSETQAHNDDARKEFATDNTPRGVHTQPENLKPDGFMG